MYVYYNKSRTNTFPVSTYLGVPVQEQQPIKLRKYTHVWYVSYKKCKGVLTAYICVHDYIHVYVGVLLTYGKPASIHNTYTQHQRVT